MRAHEESAMLRHIGWLAWAFALLTFVALAVDFAINPPKGAINLADNLLSASLLMVFAGVGALIASKRQRNPAGWFLCLVALLCSTGTLALDYAVRGLVLHQGSQVGGVAAALFGGMARSLGFYFSLTLVPLVFPTGKLLSPRWRWVVWVIVLATLLSIVGILTAPFGDYTDVRLASVRNPITVLPSQIGEGLAVLSTLTFFALAVIAAITIVIRFRRARGVERLQLKWFAYAMVTGACGGFLFLIVIMFISPNGIPFGSFFYLITVGMPISAGIPILRHRLYDIDIIINRTLVYGGMTAILAGLYFGVVIGAQTLTQTITGKQTGQQPVIIVLTTLLVAALVQPLRAWLQSAIDRRFYRSRYDAAKTLAAFSATLRSEVDLSALREHLLEVVDDTMRPARLALAAPHTRPHTSRRAERIKGQSCPSPSRPCDAHPLGRTASGSVLSPLRRAMLHCEEHVRPA